jgi:hypothetical protein
VFIVAGIVLLVPLCPAAAQVNIEPFTLGREQAGWDATIGANFKLEANETVLLEIDLSPRVDYSRGLNSVTVVGNLGFSERAGTTFRSLYLLHARYLREIDSTLSAEAFGRVQRDEFAKLNNRVSSGAGLRFEIAADAESATYAGFALGFEREEWSVAPADRHPRTLSDPRTFGYLAYRLQITENTTLLNTLSTSLRLNGDLQDGRITDTATMEVGISERVALEVTFGLSYDSRPPRSQPQVSMALTNGLTVNL